MRGVRPRHLLRRQREAKLYLRLATQIDAGFAEARYNLALLCDIEGERDQAGECYERTLAANSEYGDALFNLATISFDAAGIARPGSCGSATSR